MQAAELSEIDNLRRGEHRHIRRAVIQSDTAHQDLARNYAG